MSKIQIGDKLGDTQKNSFNVEIKKQSNANGVLTFECLEKSLPFPIKETAKKALTWVNINEEFNNELLQVSGLQTGNYDLFIDGVLISSFTANDLSTGINLALFKNTPQYKQAIEVMNACIKYRDTESVIRNLRFVEFTHLSDLKVPADLAEIERYLEARLETLKNGGHYEYHQKQFKNYILKKGSEEATLKEMSALADKIYQVNQPQVHNFKIAKHE